MRDVRNREVFRKKTKLELGNKRLEIHTVQGKQIRSEVGDHRSVGIPGNIPNPAVKRVSADGTWGATPWESKKLPTSLLFCFK